MPEDINKNFKLMLREIKAYDKIIIHRHNKPDGDAMGSQIGLKHILKENYKDKQVYMVGDAAGQYSFMEDSVMDELTDDCFDNALCIIVDCGSKALINDTRYERAACTLRFDHHIFDQKIADYEAVDTSYESCCGLITRFAIECALRVPPLAAKSLFTGMVTDSGRFRYDATTARTFRHAAFLLEQQFSMSDVYHNLYSEDYESKKLRASFLLRVNFTEHNVAYIYTSYEELKKLGTDTFTISRGMVNTMADIKGVDIWVNFTEIENDSVLCELRSSCYNINPIAKKYGGGGHKKASGATVANKETAMQMLHDLDLLATEAPDEN